MNIKSGQDQSSAKLSDLNKQILEIKKKIQLSEGQRKALFEDCEAERKSNVDNIGTLKKDISQLIVTLHESKEPTAKYLIRNKRLEEIIGPLDNKSSIQVQDLLDLQIIDKSKQLNLLRYRIKQRNKYLADLGVEYQKILRNNDKVQLLENVEKPIKRSTSELQNSIHAVVVQIREANHIKNRYKDIRQSLKADSNQFESNIEKVQEELEAQNADIAKLQKIMNEATKMRGTARGNLLNVEKEATAAAHKREKEANEGRRLVNERKAELERLERRLFQVGKKGAVRLEPEGAEDGVVNEDEVHVGVATPPHPIDSLASDFAVLKQATGGTSTEEVLGRFEAQKETLDRLNLLRNQSEDEKKQLERKIDDLKVKLDSYKYAEVKDAERKSSEMVKMQDQISEFYEMSKQAIEEKHKKDEALLGVTSGLQNLYLCLNPLAVPQKVPLKILECIVADLEAIFVKLPKDVASNLIQIEVHDEKWLPAPYCSLVRKTPLPQAIGTSPAPPPPGSEDEEEVPSRGYLKRQAQLVIDAKTRRKNIRIQLAKRN